MTVDQPPPTPEPLHPGRWLRMANLVVRRARRTWHRLELALARNLGLATREDRVFFILVPAIGVAAGFTGFLVTRAIGLVQQVLWGHSHDILPAARLAPDWVVVGAPVIGGIIVGLLIHLGRRRVSGHGISDLIEAVQVRRGAIAPRPVLIRLAAAIATVGSGGSLGREGPAIRTTAMAASWAGLKLHLPPQRLRILVACGAAGGMAAIYNTPVGAALFAMEVILGSFTLEVFGPLVVSSVLATLLGRSLIGETPIYLVTGYGMKTPWEILAYVGLGIVGAFLSLGFTAGVRAGDRLFARLTMIPAPAKPVLGMAAVGVLGLYVPEILGNGFGTITETLHEQLDLRWLLILPVAKLLATSLTQGSGCSGGLFTPSLYLGALAGGAYGWALHALAPGATASYGAYAVAGMAALAAGTSHAPISAIMILFEITGNYDLILPLMITAIISSLLARKLNRESIYTESLRERGVLPERRPEAPRMAGRPITGLVREDRERLRPEDDYRAVIDCFLATRRRRLFVIDDDRRLVGAIALPEIRHALDEPGVIRGIVARDLMEPVPFSLRDTDTIDQATEIVTKSDYERIPVLGPDGRFLGVLARRDLLALYARETRGRE